MVSGFLVLALFPSSPIDNTAQRVPRAYLSPRIRQVRYGVRSQKERFRGTRSIIVRLSFRSQHTFFFHSPNLQCYTCPPVQTLFIISSSTLLQFSVDLELFFCLSFHWINSPPRKPLNAKFISSINFCSYWHRLTDIHITTVLRWAIFCCSVVMLLTLVNSLTKLLIS